MKRDLELIRNIMIYLEENLQPSKEINSTDLPFYNENDENYQLMSEHLKLIIENGYIEVIKTPIKGFTLFSITRITTKGYDFLDALRNEKVWNQVKEKTLSVGGFTLSLLVDLGKEYIKNELFKI
ncbi:DUF2513 domain-containing protein [Aliarcobacter butzleri]|uniref:DUF2513 domain-containing protein n=1 Tax=Aliarcobacter butzleri TaxID=28197 RepID=UPI0021B279A8|nr:DUF2513 domain-containing protein [Aliarcobacter butzleri]MCT7647624.1 DUF2513 domain-containing protein [Aliarcobacter butzleri]